MKPTVHPNTKGIIFDLDGTLVNSMPTHLKACQLTCLEYGFEFPTSFFYKNAGKPTHVVFNELIQLLKLDLDGNQLGDIKERMFLDLINEVILYEYAYEILNKYHGKIPIAIGTGGLKNTVELTLNSLNINSYFDAIVTCEDVAYAKPAPDTFLKAAELINILPSNCQVFEDGDPGIVAGKQAGMRVTDVRPYLNR